MKLFELRERIKYTYKKNLHYALYKKYKYMLIPIEIDVAVLGQ